MIVVLAALGALTLPSHNYGAISAPTICKGQGTVQTAYAFPILLLRPQDRVGMGPHRLGDLPKANKEIAVLRMVGGCQVPVGVSYQVEGDGSFAGGK